MIDLEKLAQEGFRIVNGILCDKYRTILPGCVRVREFGWGTPCTEYHFDDYSLNDYKIVKSVQYDEWYLKKGLREVCRLTYLGGKDWKTYYF